MKKNTKWTIADSRELYGIEHWGAGYFDISENGSITVAPDGPDGPKADLQQIVNAISERDIELPVLVRFNGILRHRIHTIYQAFTSAIKEFQYSGTYQPAYPIKVNQQKQVVDVISTTGEDFTMALEVGSKPELLAVLGVDTEQGAPVLCNGYKDESYIELALITQKIGRYPIITIEKFSELELVLKVAERLKVEPTIGLRLRLSGQGSGRWQSSSGDRAKFGLTIAEILQCVSELERRNQQHLIKLLHFHAGSQLTSISELGVALKEAGQVYAQLCERCPSLDTIDVGGGLGVDYDGSRTSTDSSMNYSVEEYARDVIWILEDICDQAGVSEPNIITEAGRATAAYHSVLIMNVLGIANTFSAEVDPVEVRSQTDDSTVKNISYLLEELTPKSSQEVLHAAMSLRSDLIQQFSLGHLSIEDRALGDRCYWAVLTAICKNLSDLPYIPEDLEQLPRMLSDIYFCNFSLFQSLPDSWAIDQIFPITPITRLNEKPDTPVVLADITCDSDGAIDRFADLREVKRYLPAHRLKEGEPYCFATFLVGAYQEILGDLHNLFGDTNAVHVEVSQEGELEFTHIVKGDTIREVLQYVEFDKEDLCGKWRRSLEQAVRNGKISAAESGEMFKKYEGAFEGYTYLVS